MTVTEPAILWGVRFDESSYDLVVSDGSTDETLTFSVTPGRNYYVSGDGQTDAAGNNDINGQGDLLAVLESTINSHTGISGATVTLGADNKIDVSTGTLKFSAGATTLDGNVFGYTDDLQNGDEIPWGLWFPNRPPTTDSRSRQGLVGGTRMTVAGQTRSSYIVTPNKTREWSFRHLLRRYILREYATAGQENATLEWAWTQSMGRGYHFRFYPDAADIGSGDDYGVYTLTDVSEPFDRDANFRVWWQATLSASEWEYNQSA